MSRSIAVVENTVLVPNECRDELYEAYGNEIWSSEEDVTDESGKLIFSVDNYEHMDYLNGGYPMIIEILKRYEVEGDICFGSLEGDNAGEFWGYRFDGKGGMKKLRGRLVWDEKFFVGKTVAVTGTLPMFTRKETEEKIQEMGGKISKTVTDKTDILVVGADPGSKLAKAKKLGIEIIEAEEFLEIVER